MPYEQLPPQEALECVLHMLREPSRPLYEAGFALCREVELGLSYTSTMLCKLSAYVQLEPRPTCLQSFCTSCYAILHSKTAGSYETLH